MGDPAPDRSRPAFPRGGPDLTALGGYEAGAGPPVLLLHGQPGSSVSWAPLVPLLEDHHHLLVPDRPGYGTSRAPAQGMAANADAVAGLLEERSDGPATVVAHSWAGGAAVLLAASRPDLVSGLVLIGAACTVDSLDATDRLLGRRGVGDVLAVSGLVAMGEVLPRVRRLSRLVSADRRDRFLATLPDQGILGGERGALGRHRRSFMVEQRALLAELPTVEAALGEVRCPATVVTGQWDVVVRPSSGETLARALPRAELVALERSGHFAARDEPEAVAGVIAAMAARRT